MGFGDINSLIKFRDANPAHADQGRVHGLQQAGLLDRRPQEPRRRASRRTSKARSSARRPPDGAYAQWKIFVQANGIDASKVTIENVGFPVREPMLAARPGRRHHRLLVLVLHQPEGSMGVPVDDIVVHADGRLRRQSLRQRHHRESEIRRREAGGGEGLPARLRQGPEGHGEGPGDRGRLGDQAQRRRQEAGRARAAAAWRSRTTS